MILKVYLDVNVVSDYLFYRLPFAVEAIQVISLAEAGKIELLVDAHTLVFAFNFLRKKDGDAQAAKQDLINF